jgi:hypothetical protein
VARHKLTKFVARRQSTFYAVKNSADSATSFRIWPEFGIVAFWAVGADRAWWIKKSFRPWPVHISASDSIVCSYEPIVFALYGLQKLYRSDDSFYGFVALMSLSSPSFEKLKHCLDHLVFFGVNLPDKMRTLARKWLRDVAIQRTSDAMSICVFGHCRRWNGGSDQKGRTGQANNSDLCFESCVDFPWYWHMSVCCWWDLTLIRLPR